MGRHERKLLVRTIQGKKSYVEIGTLWGGSAIEVTTANPSLKAWCIDPLEGYYGKPDLYTKGHETPSPEMVIENLIDAKVLDRVTLVLANSNPFPLQGMEFDVGLIDGDHSSEAVLQDWNTLKECCKTVIFHDVDDPAIAAVIDSHVRPLADWSTSGSTPSMMVFKRKEDT
jgi:hypothetical protein